MRSGKLSLNRRRFIKNGIQGVTGALVAGGMLRHQLFSEEVTNKGQWVYRTLGRTGLKLPVVSLGGPRDPALITAALDRGIRHINTSPEYEKGNQETMIGETLKNRSRHSFVLATGFPMWRKPKDQTKAFTQADITGSLEASLRRFNLDFVDIFYLMGVSGREAVLHPPFMEAMASLKKNGKTRFIGLSAHQNEPEVLSASIEGRIYDVVLTAYNFRKIYKEEIQSAITAADKAGLGIIVMKTQAGVFWDHRTKDMINMKAALKWAVRDRSVHTAVPEFASLEELNAGISVMENLELTPEDIRDLRLEEGSSPAGLFCQNCQACLSQCRGDFDIPTIMRSYMYRYGYRNPLKAKRAIEHLDPSRILCADCPDCSVQCRAGFNVKERVLDIMRIQAVPDSFLG